MSTLNKADILKGLKTLGLAAGDKVMVHTSLAAFGSVEGGADTVIDALLEAVGQNGLVVVPTFGGSGPFDRTKTPTSLGAVPEKFWRRPEAVRSLHPTHSIAAIGKGANELVRGHEQAPTGYAEGTPYHKLAIDGGKVLLLGCDQDRNTTLHAAEAITKGAYLDTVTATYMNAQGENVTITAEYMAGPHRNFIGLDRLFRELGLMKIGKIGNAVCRLMDGRRMLEASVDALRRDPAAVLCENPACWDCVMQRGRIKESRLTGEDFTLAVVAKDISNDPEEIIEACIGEGIRSVEVDITNFERLRKPLMETDISIVVVRSEQVDRPSVELAAKLGIPLIVPVSDAVSFETATKESGCVVVLENRGIPSARLAEMIASSGTGVSIAFNPGQFAAVGENPFLKVFYRGLLRKNTVRFYVDDARYNGTPALPGMGNGEVKEIISMLRCRSFDGFVTLRSHRPGVEAFRETSAAFWKLLDEM